jgi:hypothetical protein
MSSLELYRGLLVIVNGTSYPALLPAQGAPLWQVMGQQDFIGGSSPRIGQRHLRLISLVYHWPEQTKEQALSVILTHPGELMLSCRLICVDPSDARAVLNLERKHFVREATGTGVKQWMAMHRG